MRVDVQVYAVFAPEPLGYFNNGIVAEFDKGVSGKCGTGLDNRDGASLFDNEKCAITGSDLGIPVGHYGIPVHGNAFATRKIECCFVAAAHQQLSGELVILSAWIIRTASNMSLAASLRKPAPMASQAALR